VMRKQFGPGWWKQRTPAPILAAWREKSEKAKKAGHSIGSMIEHADFQDYHQIITRKDNWAEVFCHIFGREEDIREAFNRLAPVRNADMHARIITPEDLLLVVFETQRMAQRMRSFGMTVQ